MPSLKELTPEDLRIIHEAVGAQAEILRYQGGLAIPESTDRKVAFYKAGRCDTIQNKIEKLIEL